MSRPWPFHLIAAVALSSWQVAAHAQSLPQPDPQAACERWSTSHDPEVVSMCVNHEQLAHNALSATWRLRSAAVKAECLSRITSATRLPNTTLLMCVEGGAP